MKTLHHLFIWLLIIAFTSQNAFGQGKLEEVKSEAEKPKTEETTNQTKSSGKAKVGLPSANFFEAVIIPLVFTYYVVIGDYSEEEHLHNIVSAFPYHTSSCGNYTPLALYDSTYSNARVDFMENVLLAPDLYANHLKIRIRPTHVFYLQIDYIELLEPRLRESGFDNLSVFNFNLCYDRFRLKNVNLGWTLGMNMIGTDPVRAGFTYGLSLEYFTPWQISLLASMRGSKINSRPLDQLEVYARYSVGRFMITAGYEHIRLYSLGQNFVGLGFNFYL